MVLDKARKIDLYGKDEEKDTSLQIQNTETSEKGFKHSLLEGSFEYDRHVTGPG